MNDEPKYAEPVVEPVVEVQPSDTPIQDRLKKAYIDKFNTLMVSGMTHEQVKYHIADLEDMVKVLQAQVQATMDVDDEWSQALSSEAREKLRDQDKKYRAKARPAMNADGTIKTTKPTKAKEVVIGDAGSKAFENLVDKLMAVPGMTREKAIAMVQSKGK
jgi:hypothetical protein